MTESVAERSPAATWEPFDPEAIGYERLAEWLDRFYSEPPWDEYLKCFACSSPTDFTFKATFSRDQVPDGVPRVCPECGGELRAFWSAERARAFFAGLSRNGRLAGITMRVDGEPAGCMWGYEIGPETPQHWDPRPEGAGVYLDRTIILPEHRTVAWYLFSTYFRELGRDRDYVITRTHLKARALRLLLARANFVELNECPVLPERSYWMRSLDVPGNATVQLPE